MVHFWLNRSCFRCSKAKWKSRSTCPLSQPMFLVKPPIFPLIVRQNSRSQGTSPFSRCINLLCSAWTLAEWGDFPQFGHWLKCWTRNFLEMLIQKDESRPNLHFGIFPIYTSWPLFKLQSDFLRTKSEAIKQKYLMFFLARGMIWLRETKEGPVFFQMNRD